MQSRLQFVWIASSVLALGGSAAVWVAANEASTLEARPPAMWGDRDGDFLPDAVEWVVLTDPEKPDSDGDGIEDFLEVAQRTLPTQTEGPRLDHEARAVVTVQREEGDDSVWLHLLFRFATADISALTSFAPYIDWWGYRFPLDQAVGQRRVDVVTRDAGEDGLYVRASIEIASERDLRVLMPCTVGARVVIGGREISTGAYLGEADGQAATFVGVDSASTVVQTLAQGGGGGTAFWTGQRVCLMRLSIVGVAPGGSMAVVTSSTCVSDGRLRCPPTCTTSAGQLMFFPDGLSTVTGGGTPPR